jgi:predicted TIM-barrel fold metal-dependent hydrolase
VIFPVDAERETGYRRYKNEEVAEIAAENDDILIPFASIDPHKGKAGAREARRLVDEFGVQGFKFHPTMQGFYPNDRMAYPLYEAIAETGKPALFHTGQTGVGSGMRGGNSMRLKYSNPMYLDDVAVDFPDMPIIAAHPSFPWQEEALAVAQHKPNVYIDLSGWSPKYFPPILVQYCNSILKKKMLFGSDWPMIAPERWLDAFEDIPIKEEVRPLILKENALRLLGQGWSCASVAGAPASTHRPKAPAVTSSIEGWLENISLMGIATEARVLDFGYLAASEDIAHALELEPGTDVQHAVRVRSLDGEPMSYSWSPTCLPISGGTMTARISIPSRCCCCSSLPASRLPPPARRFPRRWPIPRSPARVVGACRFAADRGPACRARQLRTAC